MRELDHWFNFGADLRQEYGNHSRGLPFGGVAFSHSGDHLGIDLISVVDGIAD